MPEAYDESFNSSPMVRFQRNGSLSCPVQFLPNDGIPWRSFSYSKIPQRPLRFTVRKLDGSSFEIEMPRNGTVAELKKAVEAVFSHLTCKVSWPHVWGHFCLSHNYEKLLSDTDPIALYGIRDGDQLEFMRHVSVSYLGKWSETEDSDPYEPSAKCIEHDNIYLGKLEYHKVGIYDDDDDDDDFEDEEQEEETINGSFEGNRKHKLLGLFRKWFTYRRLLSSEKRLQRKGSISRFFVGNSRNVRLLNRYRCGSQKIIDYNFETRSCII